MALILSSGKALTLLGGVGYDLLSGTIVRSCQSIASTVYYFRESPDYNREIRDFLYGEDLEAKITIINTFIRSTGELRELQSQIDPEDKPEDQQYLEDHLVEKIEHLEALTEEQIKQLADGAQLDPRHIALMYLQQSLRRIDHILHGLKCEVQQHRQRWFRSWRRINFKQPIRQLELESRILSQRLKLIRDLGLIGGGGHAAPP